MSRPTQPPGAGGSGAGGPLVPARPPTVFFLSDYGLSDEFVGVVHAVLHRVAPGVAVVDLTHGLPPFDVRAGAATLVRALGHLGPGVVLGVVDPGVGTDRRGVALRSGDGRWFVGPDNGLLVAAVEAAGGVAAVRVLRKPADAPATFDGRDVFAPAAALLARGAEACAVGDSADPSTLVRLPPALVDRVGPGRDSLGASDGRGGPRRRGARERGVRAEVSWVDRFGNVQLAATGDVGPPESATEVDVRIERSGRSLRARRVRAFSELGAGEPGVLVDANGHVALVVREGSATQATGAIAGDLVELVW